MPALAKGMPLSTWHRWLVHVFPPKKSDRSKSFEWMVKSDSIAYVHSISRRPIEADQSMEDTDSQVHLSTFLRTESDRKLDRTNGHERAVVYLIYFWKQELCSLQTKLYAGQSIHHHIIFEPFHGFLSWIATNARLLHLAEQEFHQCETDNGYLYHHHPDDYHHGCEPWDGCNLQDRIKRLGFEWTYQPGADVSRDLEAKVLIRFWSGWAVWMDESTALKISNTGSWIYQVWPPLHPIHCCEEAEVSTCMNSVPVCMWPQGLCYCDIHLWSNGGVDATDPWYWCSQGAEWW